MKIQKILTLIVALVGIIAVFLLGRIIGAGDEAIETGEAAGLVPPFMTVAYIVVAIAVALVVLFSIVNLFTNASALKSTLRNLVAFGVLAGIAYALANGVETPMKDGEVLSASGSKLVGAGLKLFYFLAAVAVTVMVLFGVKKAISK